jgi:hypothetical protein
MKSCGLDREELVKKYTRVETGPEKDSSSGSVADALRILELNLTIRGLQDQLKRERDDHDRRMEMWFEIGRRESKNVGKFEKLARSLALVMLDAKSVNTTSMSDDADDELDEAEKRGWRARRGAR